MILKKKIGYGLGIAKKFRVGSGIGYPSGPDRQRYFQAPEINSVTYIVPIMIELFK